MNCDEIFEGGGTKLPGLLGAHRVLIDNGFTPMNVAGTSAGAIVACLVAAGYTPEEMRKLVYDLDFKQFTDGARWPWQKMWNFMRHWGVYKGDAFEKFIQELLAKKGIKTFGDLVTERQQDLDDPRYRWMLKVIVSDVTNKRIAVFPNDAKQYGVMPDEMEVAKAVRMSMSIPFFFMPVRWRDRVFVDGGMLSNFPIWLFDSDGEPEWPTFGLMLKEQDFGLPERYDGVKSYTLGLLNTMLQAHDRKNIHPSDHFHRTITIPTGKMGTTDFDMALLDKQILYHRGREAAETFFSTWSWESYLKWRAKKKEEK